MKLLMENWRRYVNEGKSLFSHVKSGRNMDIYQNYPDTYNIYLDWVLYDKKDSAAKAYVEHFREMARKYEKENSNRQTMSGLSKLIDFLFRTEQAREAFRNLKDEDE